MVLLSPPDRRGDTCVSAHRSGAVHQPRRTAERCASTPRASLNSTQDLHPWRRSPRSRGRTRRTDSTAAAEDGLRWPHVVSDRLGYRRQRMSEMRLRQSLDDGRAAPGSRRNALSSSLRPRACTGATSARSSGGSATRRSTASSSSQRCSGSTRPTWCGVSIHRRERSRHPDVPRCIADSLAAGGEVRALALPGSPRPGSSANGSALAEWSSARDRPRTCRCRTMRSMPPIHTDLTSSSPTIENAVRSSASGKSSQRTMAWPVASTSWRADTTLSSRSS